MRSAMTMVLIALQKLLAAFNLTPLSSSSSGNGSL